jgi:hypothetical protein
MSDDESGEVYDLSNDAVIQKYKTAADVANRM